MRTDPSAEGQRVAARTLLVSDLMTSKTHSMLLVVVAATLLGIGASGCAVDGTGEDESSDEEVASVEAPVRVSTPQKCTRIKDGRELSFSFIARAGTDGVTAIVTGAPVRNQSNIKMYVHPAAGGGYFAQREYESGDNVKRGTHKVPWGSSGAAYLDPGDEVSFVVTFDVAGEDLSCRTMWYRLPLR